MSQCASPTWVHQCTNASNFSMNPYVYPTWIHCTSWGHEFIVNPLWIQDDSYHESNIHPLWACYGWTLNHCWVNSMWIHHESTMNLMWIQYKRVTNLWWIHITVNPRCILSWIPFHPTQVKYVLIRHSLQILYESKMWMQSWIQAAFIMNLW